MRKLRHINLPYAPLLAHKKANIWTPTLVESACQCRKPRDTSSVLGLKDSLEYEIATQSNILAWKVPWTEEPGRLHGP